MKILIIDEVHDELVNGLKAINHEVAYKPLITREELIKEIHQYEGVVVRTKTAIDKDVLSHAVKLKFIGRAGAGLDNVDTEYCRTQGILFFNAGEANADAVGEQTLGMLLSLVANIAKSNREVRKMIWDRRGNTGVELSEKTVGIIGYGNTGKAVAKRLSGFNVKVLVYDKYLTQYSDEYAIESTMEGLYQHADVVSLHVPLTDETRYMISERTIGKFQKSFFLMNLSRGGVVSTKDVVKALREGKILGAGLDVLENEKLDTMNNEQLNDFNFLAQSENVVLTPHIGGWTHESYYKIAKVLLQKIKELDHCEKVG